MPRLPITPVAHAVRSLGLTAAIAFLFASHAQATQMTLAQVPAGNGGKEPAPNIIVTVDDSGSMATKTNGVTGINALKSALQTVFSATNIPDDSIRLGFQAMWRCRGLSATPYKSSRSMVCPDTRIMKFSGKHRTDFDNWVKSLTAENGTPSHYVIKTAGEYMKTTGIWNPYAADPGVTEKPLLACRKSFHIFMTDGGWNSENETQDVASLAMSGANQDGTATTFPDGTSYGTSATDAYTKIYKDPYGSVNNSPIITDPSGTPHPPPKGTTDQLDAYYWPKIETLSDLAFQYWSTDLQPGIPDNLNPIIRQAGPVDYGTNGSPYVIPEYWNPKNDPATWQHLTMFTIGFNDAANLPKTRASKTFLVNGSAVNQMTPAWGTNTWDGDFAAMIRGDTVNGRTVRWGDPIEENDSGDVRPQELWHMAINGRGRFVPATDGTALTAAFSEIIKQIIVDTSAPLASIAANTQTITTNTDVYLAGYNSANWSGYVQDRKLTTGNSVAATSVWDAAVQLDQGSVSASTRNILSSNGTAGIPFLWANMSTDQQTAIQNGASTSVAQDRVNYLRGDRSKEVINGGTLRNRASRLGDIVNSNLWVVGKPNLGYNSMSGYSSFKTKNSTRPTMIYVGANDGMLHGFDSSSGNELFAYVPQGVYSNLASYTDPSYIHYYYVDGTPYTGDFYTGSAWKTALVGTLGGGGKGYFILDVTNPSGITQTSASSTVLVDATGGSDPDIGYLYAEPTRDTVNPSRASQITKLNDGHWAVVMGNGVNSTNEKAVLIIQYLDQSKVTKITLDSTVGGSNGLANPQLIDLDGDGTADVAYAGDLHGNLWKIDLTSSDPTKWGSYFPTGTGGGTPVPLFVARDTSNARQPITTAPQWAVNPVGGVMVAFGTGQEFTVADRSTISPQTLYAIWDNTTFDAAHKKMTGGTIVANGRSDLVEQTQSGKVTINGQNFFKTTSNPVTYSTASTSKRGWYMDWPGSGERSVNNGGMLSDRLLYLRSRIPAVGSQSSSSEESCTPSASSAQEFMTVLDIVTGKPPASPVFDTDGGGFTGSEEKGVSRWQSGSEDRLLIKGHKPGEFQSIKGSPGNPMGLSANLRLSNFGWRQLQ
jgi:type IV pilus assembly protein PilY1